MSEKKNLPDLARIRITYEMFNQNESIDKVESQMEVPLDGIKPEDIVPFVIEMKAMMQGIEHIFNGYNQIVRARLKATHN